MQSFRFGPEISYISDLILRLVKEQETLVGTVNKGKYEDNEVSGAQV